MNNNILDQLCDAIIQNEGRRATPPRRSVTLVKSCDGTGLPISDGFALFYHGECLQKPNPLPGRPSFRGCRNT